MIKTIPASFTLDQLLAHLREEESPEGFFTLKEWAVHFECSNLKMRDLLVEAKAAGVLDLMRVPRERLDGVMTPVPGYRFDVEDDEDVQAQDQ
jgi:hypothetical protein